MSKVRVLVTAPPGVLLVAACTLVLSLFAFGGRPAWGDDLAIVSTSYAPDPAFANFLPLFSEGWSLKDDLGNDKPYWDLVKQGATLRVCLRNQSAGPVDVARVELNSIDLAKQIVARYEERGGMKSAGYMLNDSTITPPSTRAMLDKLGQPAWYQVRPNPVPPGGFAEVTIRLRRIPAIKDLKIAVGQATGPLKASPIRAGQATQLRLASVSFSDAIDRVYVYARRLDRKDFRVRSVVLDGVQAQLRRGAPTASSGGVLPIEIELAKPWPHGSFHCIEVKTDAGETCASVIRARDAFFALGMWGYRNRFDTGTQSARDTCGAYRDHLFNTHMLMVGGEQGSYMRSDEGMKLLEEMGLRVNTRDPSEENLRSPKVYARFLMDEPDAHDYAVGDLPVERRMGSLGQGVVELQKEWTAADGRNLCLLNIDNTFKPENWLTYGALADITALDPYYPAVLISAYRKHPHKLGASVHPHYVLAASEISRYASEPRPTHVILNSTSYRDKIGDFRFPTPEEKRIEFYYALAAGAKGISYWWFAPYGDCHGCGSEEPEARALMIEMARLNVEARSLEPLLAKSCPAAAAGAKTDPFASAAPYWLMTRTLLVGTDTAIVLLVNQDLASDRVGSVYSPIAKSKVAFKTPPWMRGVHVFGFDSDGVKPMMATAKSGVFTVELKDIGLAQMLVFTDKGALESQVKERWASLQPRLQALLAGGVVR